MPNHMVIYGHYVSLHNELKKLYLGYSVKDALNNVDEKKSFLFSADVCLVLTESLGWVTTRNTGLRAFIGYLATHTRPPK